MFIYLCIVYGCISYNNSWVISIAIHKYENTCYVSLYRKSLLTSALRQEKAKDHGYVGSYEDFHVNKAQGGIRGSKKKLNRSFNVYTFEKEQP